MQAACARLGGEALDDATAQALWTAAREPDPSGFALEGGEVLWRLSLPSTAPALSLPGASSSKWGGARLARRRDRRAGGVRARAVDSAAMPRPSAVAIAPAGVFQPLAAPLAAVHRRLKADLRPAGIFSPAASAGALAMQTQLADFIRGTPKAAEAEGDPAQSACIAASAPPPARPPGCSATALDGRAGAST